MNKKHPTQKDRIPYGRVGGTIVENAPRYTHQTKPQQGKAVLTWGCYIALPRRYE